MFRFFKDRHLHKRVKEIEESLGASFSKIKEEFMTAHKRIDESHKVTDKKLNELHYRLSHLEGLLSSMVHNKYTPEKIKEITVTEDGLPDESKLDHSTLTDKQKPIFNKIVG